MKMTVLLQSVLLLLKCNLRSSKLTSNIWEHFWDTIKSVLHMYVHFDELCNCPIRFHVCFGLYQNQPIG